MKMLQPRRISPRHRDAFIERYRELQTWAAQLTANDQSLAEDLLHDLFILFTVSQPDLSKITNLDGYLYTSLRNLHLSRLRRATRRRFEQLSVAEYDSARISLRTCGQGRDSIQVQDELRRVCHFVCNRKETANSAAVLILRFFHGYYPSEIARVVRSSRRAVDDRVRAARLEVKAYLADPKAVIPLSQAHNVPDVFPARFARSNNDFLRELQQTIFHSRRGECLTRELIEKLYTSSPSAPMESGQLAHLVSCPVCLDTVNRLLGLSLLSDRYPTDTMDKDNKTGSGPSGGGNSTGSGRESLTDWDSDARDAFEHRPQELCVSVNGYVLGSQLIGAELSELTLNVKLDERINFCEVFSEQGIRLMMLNVGDSPPNGPGELRQSVELSEARMLHSTLLFSSPFFTIHVTYHDPSMTTEPATREAPGLAEADPIELFERSDPGTSLVRQIRTAAQVRASSLAGLLLHGLRPSFWLQPKTVTALFAAILIGSLALLQWRSAPAISTTQLLLQASSTEAEMLSNERQAFHQIVEVTESSANGEVLAHHRIEIWHSGDRGITARRLYDEKGLLLAGQWRTRDGLETVYQHALKPQGQTPNRVNNASPDFQTVWQLLPSARGFSALFGSASEPRLVETPSSYIISFSNQLTGEGVVSGTLVLSRNDLHAVEQTLIVRHDGETREYKFVETRFERYSPTAVPPAVLEPEPELLGSNAKHRSHNANSARDGNDSRLLNLVAPSTTATAELEVEVLRILSSAGADMGEQVNVSRTADGRLLVNGIVETADRKAEILRALGPVKNDPLVRVDILTVGEAENKQNSAAPTKSEVKQVDIAQGATIPVFQDLREYFQTKGARDIDAEIHQFSSRVLANSQRAIKHAWALRRLTERFNAHDVRALTPDARNKRAVMIGQHARAFRQETESLRVALKPIFFGSGSVVTNDRPEINSEEQLILVLKLLVDQASTNDEAIRSAFTVSAGSTTFSAIKSPRFFQLLVRAENLAAAIEASVQKSDQ